METYCRLDFSVLIGQWVFSANQISRGLNPQSPNRFQPRRQLHRDRAWQILDQKTNIYQTFKPLLAEILLFFNLSWSRLVLGRHLRQSFIKIQRWVSWDVRPRFAREFDLVEFFSFYVLFHMSNCEPRTFVCCKQNRASDENQVVQIAVKTVEQAKRSAEGSPDNAPSRKRSAFGDITNVSFIFFTEK